MPVAKEGFRITLECELYTAAFSRTLELGFVAFCWWLDDNCHTLGILTSLGVLATSVVLVANSKGLEAN